MFAVVFLWRIRYHTKVTSLKTWLNNVTNITRAVAEKGSFFQVTCRMKALNLIKSKIAGNKYEHWASLNEKVLYQNLLFFYLTGKGVNTYRSWRRGMLQNQQLFKKYLWKFQTSYHVLRFQWKELLLSPQFWRQLSNLAANAEPQRAVWKQSLSWLFGKKTAILVMKALFFPAPPSSNKSPRNSENKYETQFRHSQSAR